MTEIEARLADGSAPVTPEGLLDRLGELGIEHRTIRHAPVFTVEEARALRGDLPGAHVKNLFLRNRKGRMWLITCMADRVVELKALAVATGAKRFAFGSEERLMKFLGLRKGAVTSFGVVNDRGGEVKMVLDRAILDHELVNLHPLDNAMTTAVAPRDLVRFLEAEDHAPELLDFDAL